MNENHSTVNVSVQTDLSGTCIRHASRYDITMMKNTTKRMNHACIYSSVYRKGMHMWHYITHKQ